jgi:hypothetical protein
MAGNKADRFFPRTPADIAATRSRLSRIAPPSPRKDLAATATASRVIYPWWVEKPDEANDFNADDFAVALAAGVGAQATSAALRFQIPKGMVGVIQIFGIYILTQTALTSVRFDLRVDGVVQPGWSITNPPGVANIFVQNFSDLRIRVMRAGLIDVVFTNQNVNGPWTVGGKLAGWFMSQTGVQRLGGDQY